jgi:VCBS repeat-containing protein
MKKNYALSIVLSSALLVLSGCGDSSSVKKSVLDNNTNIEVVSNGDLAINLIDSKVNAAPVATFKTFSTNNGVVYNGLLTADDRDLDNVEFKLSIQPKHGRVTVNSNGTFVYTPEDGYVGKDNFSYTASDDVSSCPVQSVEIEVAQKPITIPNAPTNLMKYIF